MILGFVFIAAGQFFLFDFRLTKVSHLLCRNVSENVSKKNNSTHLTSPPNLALLFNPFNNTSPEQNAGPENAVNSKYFDIDKIQVLKLHDKNKSLSFCHINACSLNKNFDDMEYLLKCKTNHLI